LYGYRHLFLYGIGISYPWRLEPVLLTRIKTLPKAGEFYLYAGYYEKNY
jgi:hypothetical protein